MNWNYYHQLSPFLIQITENFGLRWYSMAYLLGATLAYFFAKAFVKQGRLSLSKEKVIDLVTYGAIGAVIGGRFGYCLFYSPHLFTDFDSSFPFWGVLKIHEGGMASHGGILGAFISLLIFSRVHKISFFPLLDLATLAGAVGIFFGRIANFINGELYGRVVQEKALLLVKFPSELFLWVSDLKKYYNEVLSLERVLPALNSIGEISHVPSLVVWKEWISKAINDSFYSNKVHYILSLIVKYSSHPEIRQSLEPLLFARHPSQLYQALLGGLVPFLIASSVWFFSKRGGLICLAWIFSYLSMRLITEFFRMPDAHLGYQWLDFTRGQWLSFALFIVALVYGFFVLKEKQKSS